ncbi:hypothetical protein EON65_32915 [archaeon]|nr:MAG: hypothetical protein EON65_32915 [archaeon]
MFPCGQVYRYFDDQLSVILEAQCFPQYPSLCNNVTELFSSISSRILTIKVNHHQYI